MAELGSDEIRAALVEDGAANDVTTALLANAASRSARGVFLAEERFVVAGLSLAGCVFQTLEPGARLAAHVQEGDWTEAGTALATVDASARALLAGERVALNFLQHLAGIATVTRAAVDAVRGTGAQITHTRKTTPGLRALERYAVRIGGGVDNRASLADAVLWKDNHWMLLGKAGQSLADVLRRAPQGIPVIVEVENEAQLEEALAARVRHMLIDNQPPDRVRRWVERAGPGVTTQASGGITLENVRAYADAGVSLISMGALTHSARAVSIRFEIT